MDIIRKHKNNIMYNDGNQFIDDTVHPNTAPSPDQKSNIKGIAQSQGNVHQTEPSSNQNFSLLAKRAHPSFDTTEPQKPVRDTIFRQHHLDQKKAELDKKREYKEKLKAQIKNCEKQRGLLTDQFRQSHSRMQIQESFISELFKQYISLNRIIQRNKQMEEKGYEIDQTFKLPLILLKFQPGTEIFINQDN